MRMPESRGARRAIGYGLQAFALLLSLQIFYMIRAAYPVWIAYAVAFPICVALSLVARRFLKDPDEDN